MVFHITCMISKLWYLCRKRRVSYCRELTGRESRERYKCVYIPTCTCSTFTCNCVCGCKVTVEVNFVLLRMFVSVKQLPPVFRPVTVDTEPGNNRSDTSTYIIIHHTSYICVYIHLYQCTRLAPGGHKKGVLMKGPVIRVVNPHIYNGLLELEFKNKVVISCVLRIVHQYLRYLYNFPHSNCVTPLQLLNLCVLC